MDYKEELARLPWNTSKEGFKVHEISKKVLGLDDREPNAVEKSALGLMDGLLTNTAHNEVYDINIGYVRSFIGDRLISDLKQELENQIVRAEESKSDDFFILRLIDSYDKFLNSGLVQAKEAVNLVVNSIDEELSKGFPEQYSDELFTAYFDADDPRVPSYTVNFKELDRFDRCVRDFMCERLVEEMNTNDEDISFKGLDNPRALLYRDNFLKGTVNGKTFPEFVMNRMEIQRGSADDGLRAEVVFDIVYESKDKKDVILDAGCRRAMLLLEKTQFFNEYSKKLETKEDLLELVKQLKEKPYCREPDVLKRYPEAGIVENFDIRDSRKYLYRKFSKTPKMHFYARRMLAETKKQFYNKGVFGAKDYLSHIISDGIVHKEIREACDYIKKACLYLEREHEHTKSDENSVPKNVKHSLKLRRILPRKEKREDEITL